MPLANLQQQIRDAVVSGDSASMAPLLVGGRHPAKRLAIHLHHYEASLTAAVVGRFPATGWLIGPRRLEDAARRFVHDHPPTTPCVAEYGVLFPAFLATWRDTAHFTYVPEFADLDWHLGRLAASIDVAAVGRERLAAIDPSALADLGVTLQSGTHYLRASWPVDELVRMYLADTSLESWTLVDEEVRIEARGARGSFRFTRLSASAYAFRMSLAEGHALGDAAGRALKVDPTFDPGVALLTLVDEHLITSLGGSQAGGPS
jgi:hypothetical protein